MHVTGIVIDPTTLGIFSRKFPESIREFNKVFAGRIVHVFPNGDRMYRLVNAEAEETFRVGGSLPIRGTAIVIGQRSAFGLTSAKCSANTVSRLVQFQPL